MLKTRRVKVTIEISDEAYRILQQRVERGQYQTLEQALDSSIHQAAAWNDGPHDDVYLEYVQERIEAGLADAAAGRTVPAEQFLTELNARRTRAA
ncbi:hypothetical protein [Terriglobus sp.]|uniref:hypothetical protein n=1 Tax=Terriglobus sp. TaxID=1889013 RepID=UPI003AFFB630